MPRFLWALALFAAAPVACSTDISVFDEGDPEDGGGGAGAGATTSAGGAGGSDVSTATTTATSATATTATTTSATTTATTTVTSTTTGIPMASIPCGNQTCSGIQTCCVHEQYASQDHCGNPGSCGDGYVEVSCNGPNDCLPGETCCGYWSQQTGYAEVSCQLSCSNTGGYTAITMCGDDPAACEPWEQCNQSQWLPQGHSFCQ